MTAQGKFNPAALAALPVAVLLALSALLPYFALDYYSFDVSGWSFFSSVDQLMVLDILLAGALAIATLLPEVKGGKVKVTLSDRDRRAFDLPLIVVPAALLALLSALIFFLIALRILFPPGELSPAVGIFLGAFLAAALAACAAGAIVFEIAPSRTADRWAPQAPGPAPTAEPQPAAVVPPESQPTRQMPSPRPAAPPPPEPPRPAAEPPPPAPDTRRA